MIQKTKLKKAFNSVGVQVNTNALNLLEDEIKRTVVRWVQRTKDGKVKRLTEDLVWIPLGKIRDIL